MSVPPEQVLIREMNTSFSRTIIISCNWYDITGFCPQYLIASVVHVSSSATRKYL